MALLSLKEQGLKQNAFVKEKKGAILQLKQDLILAEQKIIEMASTEYITKSETAIREQKLRDLEAEFLKNTESAEQTRIVEDRLQALKLEVRLYDAKRALAENHTDLLHHEMKLVSQQMVVDSLKVTLNEEEIVLAGHFESLDALKYEFCEKREAMRTAKSIDDEYVQVHLLATELQAARVVTEKQDQEILRLQATLHSVHTSKPSIVDGDMNEIEINEPSSNITRLAPGFDSVSEPPLIDACRGRIKELETQIQKLMPVYQIGAAIRDRKYEWDCRGRQNQEVLNFGEDAMKYGAAIADAILCADPSCSISDDEYKRSYGVTPAAVLEHEDFSMFHNILNWYNFLKRANKLFTNKPLNNAFGLLMSNIYPEFKVANNFDLMNDTEMMEAYELARKECRAIRDTLHHLGPSRCTGHNTSRPGGYGFQN